MHIAITMTAYRRRTYTAKVLESLEHCKGIEDCSLYIQVEPHEKKIKTMARRATPFTVINDSRLGLNRNTHAVIARCLQENKTAHAILHIEDDTVLSPDAILYYKWALSRYGDDPRIFTISGYNKTVNPPTLEQWSEVDTRYWFTCWGWAAMRHRIVEILDSWSFKNPKSFACHLNQKVRKRRKEVYPVVSRIQNIGYNHGENGRCWQWYYEHHRSPYVADRVVTGAWGDA